MSNGILMVSKANESFGFPMTPLVASGCHRPGPPLVSCDCVSMVAFTQVRSPLGALALHTALVFGNSFD